MGYWEERQAEIQAAVTKKSIAQTERQIAQYYANTQKKIIGQFQATYNHILSSIEAGKQPTPADLYKLDTYWKMQAEVAAELQKLGVKQAEILNHAFIMQYQNIYESTAIIGEAHYTQLDTKAVESMVNNIWCADGKHWSSRIWENTARLQETLNQNLIDCLVSGRNPAYLKEMLMGSFNVSYSRADMLVRTEMAHIQIQAAEQRYTDAGVEYIEIWADKDERQCEVCGKLHQKTYRVGEKLPIPAHPNCRCSILPVVDDEAPKKIESLGYKEDPQPQPQENKPKEQSQEQELTLQNNNGNILLNENQQRAQERVAEIEDIPILRLNRYNASHRQHALEITGLPENTSPKELYEAYEKICTDFFKLKIDGKEIDGFIGEDGTLYKYDRKKGLFGILFSDGKFGSVYKLDIGEKEKRWEKYKKRFLKEKIK